jgi:thiol-disulfide isomerase/thioredoxin
MLLGTIRCLRIDACRLCIFASGGGGRSHRPFPAPDFEGLERLNKSDFSPHHIAGYRGYVVLTDFWECTCINCIRDFTVLKSWYAKYQPPGFDLLGIHYAEFTMGHQAQNIRDAAQGFHLPRPIAADFTGDTWKAHKAQGWPMRYLIDANGNVVMKVFGERNNVEMESKIRSLLISAHPEVKSIALDEFDPRCGSTTLETFVGKLHGRSSVADLNGHGSGDVAEFVPPHRKRPARRHCPKLWSIHQGRPGS